MEEERDRSPSPPPAAAAFFFGGGSAADKDDTHPLNDTHDASDMGESFPVENLGGNDAAEEVFNEQPEPEPRSEAHSSKEDNKVPPLFDSVDAPENGDNPQVNGHDYTASADGPVSSSGTQESASLGSSGRGGYHQHKHSGESCGLEGYDDNHWGHDTTSVYTGIESTDRPELRKEIAQRTLDNQATARSNSFGAHNSSTATRTFVHKGPPTRGRINRRSKNIGRAGRSNNVLRSESQSFAGGDNSSRRSSRSSILSFESDRGPQGNLRNVSVEEELHSPRTELLLNHNSGYSFSTEQSIVNQSLYSQQDSVGGRRQNSSQTKGGGSQGLNRPPEDAQRRSSTSHSVEKRSENVETHSVEQKHKVSENQWTSPASFFRNEKAENTDASSIFDSGVPDTSQSCLKESGNAEKDAIGGTHHEGGDASSFFGSSNGALDEPFADEGQHESPFSGQSEQPISMEQNGVDTGSHGVSMFHHGGGVSGFQVPQEPFGGNMSNDDPRGPNRDKSSFGLAHVPTSSVEEIPTTNETPSSVGFDPDAYRKKKELEKQKEAERKTKDTTPAARAPAPRKRTAHAIASQRAAGQVSEWQKQIQKSASQANPSLQQMPHEPSPLQSTVHSTRKTNRRPKVPSSLGFCSPSFSTAGTATSQFGYSSQPMRGHEDPTFTGATTAHHSSPNMEHSTPATMMLQPQVTSVATGDSLARSRFPESLNHTGPNVVDTGASIQWNSPTTRQESSSLVSQQGHITTSAEDYHAHSMHASTYGNSAILKHSFLAPTGALGNGTTQMPVCHRDAERSQIAPQNYTAPHCAGRPGLPVTFGIGGRLAIVSECRVRVHRIRSLCTPDPLLQLMEAFPGPLVCGKATKAQVERFLDRAPALLSAYLQAEQVVPESVSLLAEAKLLCSVLKEIIKEDGSLIEAKSLNHTSRRTLKQRPMDTICSCLQQPELQGQEPVFSGVSNQTSPEVLRSIDHMVASGQMDQAVDTAINNGLWGFAIVLSKHSGVEKEKYVVERMSSEYVPRSSPLSMLLLNSVGEGKNLKALLEDQNKSAGNIEEIKDSWARHISTLLHYPTHALQETIVAFGDMLMRERNSVLAAHALYLLAGIPLQKENEQSFHRLVLIGSNYGLLGSTIRKDSAAWMLSEIWEFSKILKNSQGYAPFLQPYKLFFVHKLVELGFTEKAADYLSSIEEVIRVSGASIPTVQQGVVIDEKTSRAGEYHPSLLATFAKLKERLGRAASTSNGPGAVQQWVAKPLSNLLGRVLNERSASSNSLVEEKDQGSSTPESAPPVAESDKSDAKATGETTKEDSSTGLSKIRSGLLSSVRSMFRPKGVTVAKGLEVNSPEPYYDEKLGRFVIPGADNDEDDNTPNGPPPTAIPGTPQSTTSSPSGVAASTGNPAAQPPVFGGVVMRNRSKGRTRRKAPAHNFGSFAMPSTSGAENTSATDVTPSAPLDTNALEGTQGGTNVFPNSEAAPLSPDATASIMTQVSQGVGGISSEQCSSSLHSSVSATNVTATSDLLNEVQKSNDLPQPSVLSTSEICNDHETSGSTAAAKIDSSSHPAAATDESSNDFQDTAFVTQGGQENSDHLAAQWQWFRAWFVSEYGEMNDEVIGQHFWAWFNQQQTQNIPAANFQGPTASSEAAVGSETAMESANDFC
eukprot:gb/GECG01014988.1/.p1 GENE.gb/GECG01014988.1/~~gb/GECG01014988.1/.p1  ORF type:complete len:1652 (+),score=259.93 gb/GECG01014988.1/:1-4956(+)